MARLTPVALAVLLGCAGDKAPTDDTDDTDDAEPSETCDAGVARVELVGADRFDATDGGLPTEPDPPDSVWVSRWPSLIVELLGDGFDARAGTWEAAYCPVAGDPADCVTTPVTASSSGVLELGTAALGAVACPDRVADRFTLAVRSDDHACGPLEWRVLSDVQLVVDDCDGDGVAVDAGDCADTDPSRYPGAPEVCGGGDLDCDGLDPAGVWADDAGGTGTSSDLQAALDAGPGSTYQLCAGTWPALSVTRDTTLVGVGGSTEVVVDAAGAGPTISTAAAAAPVALVLEGLQVTGGASAAPGGGVDGSRVSSLTITDCEIHGNSAASGGGVFATGETTMRGTTVHDNDAGNGGGLVITGADLTMETSTVSANTASAAAGVKLTDGSATLDAVSLVEANVAASGGGGVELRGTTSWSGGIVSANEATFGAGMRPHSGPGFDHSISDVLVIGNVSVNSGAGMSAFPGVPGPLMLTDVRFEANEAGLRGGGLYVEGPLGGLGDLDLDLSGLELVDNVAAEDGGGFWGKDVQGELRDSTLDGNTSWTLGGGLYAKDAHLTLDTVTFVGNAASDPAYVAPAYPSGGAVAVESGAELDLVTVTIDGNTATRGGGIYVGHPTAVVRVRSGSVLGNTADDVGDAGLVGIGVLTGCDAAALSWTGAVSWFDGLGALQSFTPASGCFTVDGLLPGALDGCSCPP